MASWMARGRALTWKHQGPLEPNGVDVGLKPASARRNVHPREQQRQLCHSQGPSLGAPPGGKAAGRLELPLSLELLSQNGYSLSLSLRRLYELRGTGSVPRMRAPVVLVMCLLHPLKVFPREARLYAGDGVFGVATFPPVATQLSGHWI